MKLYSQLGQGMKEVYGNVACENSYLIWELKFCRELGIGSSHNIIKRKI